MSKVDPLQAGRVTRIRRKTDLLTEYILNNYVEQIDDS